MVCDDAKRVIVIKGIQSNLIEEAILVLKSKPESNGKRLKTLFAKDSKKENAHILQEAEEIINNYIREKKCQSELGKELVLRPYHPKGRIFSNTVINLALLGSIALLIFMVTRFF